MPRELDDEDRVLGGQSHQHHEADLGKDVDRHAPEVQAGRRGQQAHRYDQHDRQRQLPALVLRRQHEEHEDGGAGEDRQGWDALLLLLMGKVRPFERDAGRQHLLGKIGHARHGRAGRDARRGGSHDIGGGVEVVARHAIGRGLVIEGGD